MDDKYRHRKALLNNHWAPGSKTPRTNGMPANGDKARDDCCIPLVEADHLFLHAPFPIGRPGSASCRSDGLPPRILADVPAFLQAFQNTWHRLPKMDRLRLLNFWEQRSASTLSYPFRAPGPREKPLIQLVPDESLPPEARYLGSGAQAACAWFGHVLAFTVSATGASPEELEFLIARVLGLAYRMATREHWRLVNDLVEEPMAQWEAQHGDAVTDDDCDAHWDTLDAAFLQQHAIAMDLLLRRWGFLSPPCPVG